MKYFLLLLLGVLGWSMSPVFVRYSTAPSMVLVIYRMGITMLLIGLFILLKQTVLKKWDSSASVEEATL